MPEIIYMCRRVNVMRTLSKNWQILNRNVWVSALHARIAYYSTLIKKVRLPFTHTLLIMQKLRQKTILLKHGTRCSGAGGAKMNDVLESDRRRY